MEPLQLSKDQKGKLLEMCKILFTNYADIVISGLDVRLIIQWEDLRGRHTKQEYIPWFEMCMTYLAERILNPKNEINSNIKKKLTTFFLETSAYSWFIQDPGIRESFADHPVDYLYEKFKKLKK